MQITLPFPPRRSQLRVLCGALGLGGGLLIWLLLAVIYGVEWAVLAVPIGLALGLALSFWRPVAIFAYRAVNKLAREFGSLARTWITALVFMIVVVAGWLGSSLPMSQTKDGGTYWHPTEDRGTLRETGAPTQGGLASVIHWMRHSNKWWTSLLLPFFLMLDALEQEEETRTPPENIYTLY